MKKADKLTDKAGDLVSKSKNMIDNEISNVKEAVKLGVETYNEEKGKSVR